MTIAKAVRSKRVKRKNKRLQATLAAESDSGSSSSTTSSEEYDIITVEQRTPKRKRKHMKHSASPLDSTDSESQVTVTVTPAEQPKSPTFSSKYYYNVKQKPRERYITAVVSRPTSPLVGEHKVTRIIKSDEEPVAHTLSPPQASKPCTSIYSTTMDNGSGVY